MRLIDADELLNKVHMDICRTDCVISTMFDRRFKKLIEEALTIEPVTRCENCHNCIEIDETLYCNFWNRNTEYDWYCCQGW